MIFSVCPRFASPWQRIPGHNEEVLMKKIVCVMLAVLMSCLLAMPAMATSEGPVITLQPQSPNYPQYSVAIYTVKAEGTNLQATWYMEWLGKTYTISDIGGTVQPWEAYAGEAYGSRKLDDNTFIFVFEGIEYDLDGAYIWCVIEDGHYGVTSQKNRISVGNENMPPEIVSIPTGLTVEQGDLAEIRCVAKSTDDSQLSYLWYETDTGKRENIRAVNRGEETNDTMVCDTDNVGARNYLCMVESANGGMTYSSVVTVTVTEKQTVTDDPNNPHEPPTDPTQPSNQPTAPTETTTPSESLISPTETTAPSEQPTSPTETTETNKVPDKDTTDAPDEQLRNEGLSGWVVVLIAVVAAGFGFGLAVIFVKKN